MNDRQREMYNSLKRIQSFVNANPLPIPLRSAPSGFQGQVGLLNTALTQVESFAISKGSGEAFRRSAHLRQLRDILRYRHLYPIRRAARVLEKETVGLPRLVNLPRRFGSEQELLTAAQATAADVTPFAHLFIAKGLPDNFLAQLQSAIVAIAQANQEYESVRTRKVTGRAGVAVALRIGMDARTCLNLIVERCCTFDSVHGPSTLEAWQSVSRIHRAPTGNEGAEAGAPNVSDASESAAEEAVGVQGEG
jgi:hypothetical protein